MLHNFSRVPAYFSAWCFACSFASAKLVVVVGPYLFTWLSWNQSHFIHFFTWIIHHQCNLLILSVELGVFDCFPGTMMANDGLFHCCKFGKSRSHAIPSCLFHFLGDQCCSGFKTVQLNVCIHLFPCQGVITHVHTLSFASSSIMRSKFLQT